MTSIEKHDDTKIEQLLDDLLDDLLDATLDEREALLQDIESREPELAARARRLVTFAVDGDAPVPDTVNQVAPDLFAELVTADESERIGEELGPYRITAFIARGGMGVVYRAERCDGNYEQTVAIKFTPKFVRSEHKLELFERERAYLARLEHPNVARIIDAGVASDGTPYYVMEYIDGERIDEFTIALGEHEKLELFMQLCDAVAYCHRSPIVHGDIKPGNVLVSEGRVRLLDFGIGRLLDDRDASDLLEDVRAFSPDYAAPEQLAAERPGIPSDIFSLGALLAKVLTGSRPDRDEPNSVRTRLPEDLAAIVLRCIEDKPDDRYPSVDALQQDLAAYLAHFPVSARRQTRRYRSARFVRRNRLLVASVAAIIVGLGAGLGVAVWQYQLASVEATRAQQVAGFLKSLFERAGPYNSGEQDVTLLELMDDAAARLPGELPDAPDVRTEVRQLIASGYYGIGEYEKSFVMREEARAYWQERRKEPDIEIARALMDLGDEHTVRGDYDDAATLHRQAIGQLVALGLENADVAEHAWTRLGRSLSRSDPQGSLAAMRRAHEINLAIRPDDGKAIARSLANIAFGLRAVGNNREAADVSVEALALAEANGERLAKDIIDARCNLALDYTMLGRGDQARAALRECIALAVERMGSDHPDLVAKYNNLGAMELASGRLTHAEESLEAALTLAHKTLPGTSLYRLAAEINYALMLLHSGRAAEAEPRARDALANMEASLGAAHPASGRVRSLLGRIVLARGNHEQATRLIESSLEGLSKSWQADALLWLAEAKMAGGNLSEASALAGESLAIRESTEGFYPWQVAEARFILAVAMDDAELRAESRRLLDSELRPGHMRRQLGPVP